MTKQIELSQTDLSHLQILAHSTSTTDAEPSKTKVSAVNDMSEDNSPVYFFSLPSVLLSSVREKRQVLIEQTK